MPAVAFAVLAHTAASTVTSAAWGHGPTEACDPDLRSVAAQVVNDAFSTDRARFEVKAANDVRCERPDDMANVAIVVRPRDEEPVYGIFHVHFRHGGSDLESAAAFENDKWRALEAPETWKQRWCRIITLVYPEQIEAEGCGRYTGIRAIPSERA